MLKFILFCVLVGLGTAGAIGHVVESATTVSTASNR